MRTSEWPLDGTHEEQDQITFQNVRDTVKKLQGHKNVNICNGKRQSKDAKPKITQMLKLLDIGFKAII